MIGENNLKTIKTMAAKKQTGFRFDEELLERLRIVAREERRSLNNLIEIILEDWVDERDKVKQPGN